MNAHVCNNESVNEIPPPAGSGAPPGFVRLTSPLHPWIDRKLGYFGNDRYVLFYYEPRGDEVIWKDGRSYGFATGAWCTFNDQIAPLANAYRVDLGNAESPGKHALFIDRQTKQAYFAERRTAERLLDNQ